jgi:peptidoglycan/LPS O-acetylase OafA/YrhL
MARMKTLGDALAECRGIGPGFHMLRHLLSVVILAHHCRVAVFGVDTQQGSYVKAAALSALPLGAMSRGAVVVELLRPGLYALVGMFFALSGFLVVASALRNPSIKVFFVNRALRILPALSVEVTLSALVLGPLFTKVSLGHYFTDPEFFRYFGNILGQVTFQLPGVFAANPWPRVVNANLWTLPAEFWCYFCMLAMMVTGTILHRKKLTVAILGVAALALLLGFYDPATFSVRHDSTHFAEWYIVLMFFFGVFFYINAGWIALSPLLFVACAAGYYLLTLTDTLGALSGLLLSYCMVYIGMRSFPWFDRVLKKDLSYGTYLYGFPITQAVVSLAVPHLAGWSRLAAFLVIFPVVLGLTLLFSSLSWDFIEKPTLRLRGRMLPPSRPKAAAAAYDAVAPRKAL